MSGRLLIFVGIALLVGCKAPPPTVNPLAGYGSPRVPPPATGAAKDPYFTGSTTSNANPAAASQPGSANYATASASSNPSFAAPPAGSNLNWRGTDTTSGNAGFSGSLNPTPTNPSGPSGPIGAGASNNGSSLNLNSMTVNDALSAPPAPVDVRGGGTTQATPAVYSGYTQPAATAPTTVTTPTVPSLFNPQTPATPLQWGN